MIRPHSLVRVVGLSPERRPQNLDSDPLRVTHHHQTVVAFVREMGGRVAIELASIVSKVVERLSATAVGVA